MAERGTHRSTVAPTTEERNGMRNSPGPPIVALGVAAALAVVAAISYFTGPSTPVVVRSQLEIGLTVWALTLTSTACRGWFRC
jgi:hypothetical protein